MPCLIWLSMRLSAGLPSCIISTYGKICIGIRDSSSFLFRLFDLVADDNAIVDTIYYLGKALNSERIDLVTFMKVYIIRTLSIFESS